MEIAHAVVHTKDRTQGCALLVAAEPERRTRSHALQQRGACAGLARMS